MTTHSMELVSDTALFVLLWYLLHYVQDENKAMLCYLVMKSR